MTTIVYRDGIVAADSRTTNGDWINPAPTNKLVRDGDAVYALCGDMADAGTLLAWIKASEGPQPGGECTVVRFVDREITTFSDGGSFATGSQPFAAWGTGAPMALGALHVGATAEEAVRAACKVDPFSGEPVISVKVR